MSYHQLLSLIITLTVTGFSIPLLISRIKMMSLSYHKLNLGHYEKVKELCGKDARDNLCELRVALAAFTYKELSAPDIEWFVHTPGAFKYLKKFGKCHKYLSINISTSRFVWKQKFQSRFSRFTEQFKVFMFYLLSGTSGLSIILACDYILQTFGLVPTIFSQIFAVLLCCFAVIFLWKINIIGDATRLVKTEIY